MSPHSITFEHRKPTESGCHADYAEFAHFLSLCASAKVAQYVDRVFFDTKWMGHTITVARQLEGTDIHRVIASAAKQSLGQFLLFDVTDGRNYLEASQ